MATCVLDEVGASTSMKARFDATRQTDGAHTAERHRWLYTSSHNASVEVRLTVEGVN